MSNAKRMAANTNDEQVLTDVTTAGKAATATRIAPLAKKLADKDIEVSRRAKRSMWKTIREVGRPGHDGDRAAVVAELIELCGSNLPASAKREVLWMLSEIAGDEAVETVAGLLGEKRLREYARMVLERIPGQASLDALKVALTEVPDDFKSNIAQSLRQRGVKVPGLPCRKLVPVKQTKVKPVGR